MKLDSFASSEALKVHGKKYFLVENDDGKHGLFDPKGERSVVPCDFEEIEATVVPNLWKVTEFGRSQSREFGSKGVTGIFDSESKKLIIPTICEDVSVCNLEWIAIITHSKEYFRWYKIGLHSIRNKALYVDTSYEEDWIPRWPGLKVVPTAIPACYPHHEGVKIIEHADDILIIDMFDVPVIFSRAIGKVIYSKDQ